MKTAQDFLKEANDIVIRIDTNEAINMVLMKQYLSMFVIVPIYKKQEL